MNKTELIAAVAEKATISKKDAGKRCFLLLSLPSQSPSQAARRFRSQVSAPLKFAREASALAVTRERALRS